MTDNDAVESGATSFLYVKVTQVVREGRPDGLGVGRELRLASGVDRLNCNRTGLSALPGEVPQDDSVGTRILRVDLSDLKGSEASLNNNLREKGEKGT